MYNTIFQIFILSFASNMSCGLVFLSVAIMRSEERTQRIYNKFFKSCVTHKRTQRKTVPALQFVQILHYSALFFNLLQKPLNLNLGT